eukprot:179322_1
MSSTHTLFLLSHCLSPSHINQVRHNSKLSSQSPDEEWEENQKNNQFGDTDWTHAPIETDCCGWNKGGEDEHRRNTNIIENSNVLCCGMCVWCVYCNVHLV